MMSKKVLSRAQLEVVYTDLFRDKALSQLKSNKDFTLMELRVESTDTVLSLYRTDQGEFSVYIWAHNSIKYHDIIFLCEIEDGSGIKRAMHRFMDFQNREGLRELSYMMGGVVSG